ncbi:DEAD/DEAH box DNA helicase [Aspergillus heteromorphus CBS 117.55]|uniref:DNA 3'-5' helicase n=1 Tax=Aspergillus heteromorphus CBS 117.55 TaxID=1448321 RepID=A0A317WSY4_9EURO|nr:DEAD/DEAH box DNA helicase [Aspergillus heteromorphus CBS 117.55]PWY88402.1 DEAD/DEAH box DNA helicase [Aspergillus heteromorphus CBS 117.55]
MRRKPYHPFPTARQNTHPRRKGIPPLPTPRRSNPSGIIDRRSVEDAQLSCFTRTSEDLPPELQPFPPDDDMELDAFDLELLAQPQEKSQSLQVSAYPTDRAPLSSGPSQTAINVSRFFHVGPHATPHQSLGSSSPDMDIRSQSSPLVRLQAERSTAQSRDSAIEYRDIHTLSYHEDSPMCTASAARRQGERKDLFKNIPASVRGIVLVSVHELPDNCRAIFPFPVFNAVQSKCFHSVYKTDNNIVLAAPTGSGKTVIMELAICRLVNCLKDEQFKVVYQAPTKSLCSEKFRDWTRKFHTLGLQCTELTGDTDHMQLRSVQNSQIIITTPEKWDSMTRKWKDHTRLMQLVKLFLIDEVHILKEARGATLEAVVSRMKTNGSNVRFVALSATVPNSDDIATWLGKDATNQHMPAHREHFGEDFRPVKLQKIVYGYQSQGNDFAFDKMCSSKVPDVIASHSCRKPIMIFCCTRNSAAATAKELASLWSRTNPPARLWKGSGRVMEVHNLDLKATIGAGVAFHHAGLDPADRRAVEAGFLQGQISIICCTSTLAVGVNLPCHLVIIKGTVAWQEEGCKEYSDLEIMQMLGRAGRPQFDDSAIAVIMTRKERENRYEKLVTGSESLESCLHLNLVDHLNAEIGLGNVTDIDSAIRWLAGTFLFVRMRRNPTHYQLKEDADKDDEDEMLRRICEKDIKLLQECGLVSTKCLKSTKFGDAMARYYVRFETMRTLLTLKPHSSMSQILAVIAKAEEFRDVRLKAGEKSLYKEINRASATRFPVNVDVALSAHKISLLIQSELGAVDLPDGEQYQKHKFPLQQDKTFVFSHINRLIRCVIDCQVALEDSITLRNALELARSFRARVWDDSPLQMKQIEQVGVVAVRKLMSAGISSIETLELCEPHQLDMILSRNPPFGRKMLDRLVEFPKLRVSVKMTGKDTKPGSSVRIQFRAEIAFMNEKCPTYFRKRPVYVCFLAETSDGRMIDFRRMSATKLPNGQDILLGAELKGAGQFVTCYAMCDDIAGTMRSAQLKPDLPDSCFPSQLEGVSTVLERPMPNISRRRSNDISRNNAMLRSLTSWDSDDLLFDDVLEKDQGESLSAATKLPEPPKNISTKKPRTEERNSEEGKVVEADAPTQLANGNWACNHRCKDKTTCKHFCCRDGLEKPPKASKRPVVDGDKKARGLSQTTLSAAVVRKGANEGVSGSKACENQAEFPELKSKTPRSTSSQDKKRDIKTDNVTSKSKSPSEFDDDSFSDFPSPTVLLFGIPATPKDHAKDLGSSNAGKSGKDVNEDWTDDEIWLTMHSPLPAAGPAGQDKVVTSKENAETASGTHIQNGKTASDTNRGTASQASIFEYDDPPDSEIFPGRKRDLPFSTTSDGGSNGHKKCKINKENCAAESQDNKSVTSSAFCQGPKSAEATFSNIPEGWEDIDPALLSEYKDIINLF